jgi:hypothetical protein|tara:strand:- start:2288 stop:2602 length:315 start_codon:yes stop_codon:yes gene_type:complete
MGVVSAYRESSALLRESVDSTVGFVFIMAYARAKSIAKWGFGQVVIRSGIILDSGASVKPSPPLQKVILVIEKGVTSNEEKVYPVMERNGGPSNGGHTSGIRSI